MLPDDGIDPDFVPQTPEDMARCLASVRWRLLSGQLYKIIVKEADDDEGGVVMPFRPNKFQIDLLEDLWFRTLILKARQLGFTTLIAIAWLDHALFNANQRVGIVAQDKDAASSILRDKVRFAYDNLPPALRAAMPLKRDSAEEMLFAHNNSSIRVATSYRGGTPHRLHISEFGKICAKYPEKAAEVVSGSLPAVPMHGIAVIESTAEGNSGPFFRMSKTAEANHLAGKAITEREWRFHFVAWWESPDYEMDPDGVVISEKDHAYFDVVEAAIKRRLSMRKRAWYVATRDNDFSGDEALMWREYPSTPDEAFQQSNEGAYYTKQLAIARKQRRITRLPWATGIPVNTFWDIGNSDGTGIWLHQRVGAEDRFLKYIEAWGEPYIHFIQRLQQIGLENQVVWGTHYLPHDATHERQQGARIASPIQMLKELTPGWRWSIVPRVDDIQNGIQITRSAFSQYWFDEEGCKEGLAHLAAYRKKWNKQQETWSDTPDKTGGHSEAADAIRQHAQGYKFTPIGTSNRPRRRTSGGMAT